MNKWARPFDWHPASAAPAGRIFAPTGHQYFAYLSYSHKDSEAADWLHQAVEKFRVPRSLAGRLTTMGVIPRRLTPVFRDRHELAAASDLGDEIRAALGASHFLIVLCSPAAARSKWTNAEIDAFKKARGDGCVVAAILDGEPFASDVPGREDEECFPPALRVKYTKSGRPTTKRAEPLAADLRDGRDGRKLGLRKIIAGMLGVGLDALVHREQARRQKRLAWLAAASLAGMGVTSTLAIAALQARNEAREQRRQAEGLVEFMVGDLRDKLEPIGKLDVLDDVGARVLDYYSKQDTSELSDVALAQRSKALALMGQIASDRGNLDRADGLYRAAYAGTAEEVRRDPKDPQRLYDHAQNVFYLAAIAAKRGRLGEAEAGFREYQRLADQMVALDPENMKWRMEVADAATNLGYALYSRRDYTGSLQQYERAQVTIQAVAAVDPGNVDYQSEAATGLPLLADSQEAAGRLSDAIVSRKRYIALVEGLLPKIGAQADFLLVPAHRDLGRLYAETGQDDLALQEFQAAVAKGEALQATDPTALKWVESTDVAKLYLARLLFNRGQTADAAGQAQSVCAGFQRLVAQDPTVALRQSGLRDCLILRAQTSLHSGDPKAALAFAVRAVQVSRAVKSTDPMSDRFGVANALRVMGDTRNALGDSPDARSAWAEAESALPRGIPEKPEETFEQATIAERAGDAGLTAASKARLAEIGYRDWQ